MKYYYTYTYWPLPLAILIDKELPEQIAGWLLYYPKPQNKVKYGKNTK